MHIIRAQFLLVSLVAITLPLEIGCGGSQMGGSGGQGGGPGWSEGSVHSLATGKVPASLAVGDFNSDGKPDLAVANAGEPVLGEYIDSSVTVLLGNGDGTFQAVDYPTEAGSVYGSVAVGDFNGDKKLDLLASGYLLVGNGDGTFQTSLATGSGAKVLAADFNGDAKLDLAENGAPVLFAKAGEVSVQLGNGDGTFQSPVVYGLNLETSVPGLGGGDLNGDGKPDWAVTACGPVCSLYVFLSNGDGTFESLPPVGIWSVLSGPGATSIAMGDFDGDGKTDLAVPWDQGSNQGVSVLLGNGAPAPITWQVPAGNA